MLYDVVAVDVDTRGVRLLASGKKLPDADAIVCMAVMRRGVEEEFFFRVPAGSYKDGDQWRGKEQD